MIFWRSIADAKITLPDDPDADIKAIRELLDDNGLRHQ